MPPEVLEELPGILGDLEQLGLRAWLILSIIALIRRWVITRQTYDDQVTYVEARRVEEREGRIAAEKRVSELTERWDRALGIMANIERELIRAVSRGDR